MSLLMTKDFLVIITIPEDKYLTYFVLDLA